MKAHRMAPTTHTIEMDQIHEINAALGSGRRVTAGDLGVAATVPRDAVLRYLVADGSPSYPYIFGHFSRGGTEDTVRVALHTAQLRAISGHLSMRSHIWGVGSLGSPQP